MLQNRRNIFFCRIAGIVIDCFSSLIRIVEHVWNVMAHAQKPGLVFQRNGRVHWNPVIVKARGGGGRFSAVSHGSECSRVLAMDEIGSAGSHCGIFKKYVDYILKMSLQGGKKRVKRSGESEIVCVYIFMKTESEVGITIPLSKVQKRVPEATRVSRRTLCRILKEGENVETGVFFSCTSRRVATDCHWIANLSSDSWLQSMG